MIDTKPERSGDRGQSPAARGEPSGDWLAVLRILLIMQGAIVFVSTIESAVVGVATGGLTIPLALAGLVATGLTLHAARAIGRLRRRTRKLVVLLEVGWLTMATFDMGLAIIITQQPLELVPLLTRMVLPAAILGMLRTNHARLMFEVPPSRRQRRRARKAQKVEARLG